MLEKLKEALDKGLTTGILLTDLIIALDCISHDLLVAKLYAYGSSEVSLKLIYDYLSGRGRGRGHKSMIILVAESREVK